MEIAARGYLKVAGEMIAGRWSCRWRLAALRPASRSAVEKALASPTTSPKRMGATSCLTGRRSPLRSRGKRGCVAQRPDVERSGVTAPERRRMLSRIRSATATSAGGSSRACHSS
jgi:hypothetical protein